MSETTPISHEQGDATDELRLDPDLVLSDERYNPQPLRCFCGEVTEIRPIDYSHEIGSRRVVMELGGHHCPGCATCSEQDSEFDIANLEDADVYAMFLRAIAVNVPGLKETEVKQLIELGNSYATKVT